MPRYCSIPDIWELREIVEPRFGDYKYNKKMWEKRNV